MEELPETSVDAHDDKASAVTTRDAQYFQAPLPQGALEVGQVILRDGTTAELRPIRADDRELIEAFVKSISAEARTHRFFGNVSVDFATDHLMTLGQPDMRMSLLVLTGEASHKRVIAHGEYTRDNPESDAAEVAFLVADSHQGKGLGTLLLERLALIAVRHGIQHFYGPTEASNRKMRDLFKTIGFPVREDRDGGYVDVSFSILPSRESIEKFEMRERIATIASLRPFFNPKGVAVIGASRRVESLSYRLLETLILNRFQGPVYPVNLHANVVGSIPAFARVTDIPADIDLAVIAVPADAVLNVVEDCGQKGVRALIIISSGFADAGAQGQALQQELIQKARGYGMRLIGPNGFGMLNSDPNVRLNASLSSQLPEAGHVAISSQSGALGLAVLEVAQQLGLGLSSFVSLGNTADVSGNDLIQYWEDDDRTSVILLYLESFGNPRRFARLARRIGRKKPLLVVKAGRYQNSSFAEVRRGRSGVVGAQPQSLALRATQMGDVAVEALFHQAGIIRANTLEEMFDVAALLAGQPLPRGARVGVITNATGPAVLTLDALQAEGLSVPGLSEASCEALAEIPAVMAGAFNPVQLLSSATAEDYFEVSRVLLADDTLDALLILFIPVGLADRSGVAEQVKRALVAARNAACEKTVLTCFMGAQGFQSALRLEHESVPSYRFPEAAARALGRVNAYAQWRQQPLGIIPDHKDIDVDTARRICRQHQHEGWLAAQDVAAVLAAFGIPLVTHRIVRTQQEAVNAAQALGYPVAVKLASRTLISKSEWDGVKLNLHNDNEVLQACEAMQDALRAAGKQDALEGFVVQPMITNGVELMIGMSDHPLFGPIIAFGLGGIYVEVLHDVVYRITPLTDRDATEMLSSIRGYPLLTGYRNAPAADLNAVHDLLLRVSRLVEEIPEITELELNPVKAHVPGEGVSVLDARIRV